MKRLNPIITWACYIIGMLIAISIMVDRNYILEKLLIGCLIGMIAWISILIELIKNPIKDKGMWIYLLIFVGGVAMPVYLITRKERLNEPKS